MLLTAVVTKAELTVLLASLAPMRVMIDERRDRSVTLGRPELSFVPGKGIRLRGDARIAWDVAGIAVPVTLQGWQLLLIPRIHTKGTGRFLALEPVVEELDLKLVPGFLDDKIADAITEWIANNRARIAWNFARTLSKRLPLPKRISPAETFEILVTDGDVEVTESELRLNVRFEAHIDRAPAQIQKAKARERVDEKTTDKSPPSHPAPTPPRHASR